MGSLRIVTKNIFDEGFKINKNKQHKLLSQMLKIEKQ